MKSEFSSTLRLWRGRRRQKEAAAVLDVPLETYRGWEYSKHHPAAVCENCLRKKMEANPDNGKGTV